MSKTNLKFLTVVTKIIFTLHLNLIIFSCHSFYMYIFYLFHGTFKRKKNFKNKQNWGFYYTKYAESNLLSAWCTKMSHKMPTHMIHNKSTAWAKTCSYVNGSCHRLLDQSTTSWKLTVLCCNCSQSFLTLIHYAQSWC